MSATTRILSIDRDSPDEPSLDEAAAVLRRGGLVAFATETVYGLGADATNPEAVARIFAAKGRPATNPLIVHADGVEMARRCVADWPEEAQVLADRFWPGPLTLVLPRSDVIPDSITAGRETVGVRVPEPAVARGLIGSTGRPIAAPSGNRSTGLSPTRAEHVLKDLDGKIDLILDSGPTDVGLESTVLDLTGDAPRVLRPGPIGVESLSRALARGAGAERLVERATSPSAASPGQMAIHYTPNTPAMRVEPGGIAAMRLPPRFALLVLGRDDLPGRFPQPVSRLDLLDPARAAAVLYATLHDWDEKALDLIVIVMPPETPEWEAIRDRLRRATRPAE